MEKKNKNRERTIEVPYHEVLPVKTTNGFEYIVVRNVGKQTIITQYGGRKYYATHDAASRAIGSKG